MSRLLLLRLCVALAAVSVAAGSVAADPGDGLPEADAVHDTTTTYRTSHNHLLALPQLLWRLMVYPVGELTIFTEREELPQRARKLFTNDAGTFGVFPQVQLGGETDTGVGARLFHTDLFGDAQSLDMLYVFSHADRQRAEVLYHDPRAGGRFYWEAFGDYLDTDHEDATINGVIEGRESLDDLVGAAGFDVLLVQQRADARVALGWRSNAGPLQDYRAGFTAEARAGWALRDLSSTTAVPDLNGETSTPAASRVPGLGNSLTYGWAGLRLAWDDRDAAPPVEHLTHSLRYQFPGRVLLQHEGLYHSFRNIAYPERGGLAEVSFDVARGADDVRFSRLGAEVQRYHTLFWKERVLAGRIRLDKVFVADDGLAPYNDLPTLGGGNRLRGYERGTYRGEGALLLALEYRWPVWDTWNASLFWEEGQVFDDFGDLQSDGFASSVGAGLTLRTETAFLLGLRLAHSARANVLLGFSLEQEF